MPKGKRNLMVADALRDPGDPEIDEADETPDEDEIPPVHVAAPAVVEAPVAAPAPTTPITMTLADLQAVMATVAAGNSALAEAVTQGIANAREPIPENKLAPGISVYNPVGDREHPRPGLKCKVTFGVKDAKSGIVTETYPLEADDLTVIEQIALNTLEPAHAVVQRLDGVDMKVSVVPELDPVNDRVLKLTLVLPTEVTAKGSQVKNMLPGIVSLVAQITGRDFGYLAKDHDSLKWFMAEHRAGRYVATRESVAA